MLYLNKAWRCLYCSSLNDYTNFHCTQCSGPRQPVIRKVVTTSVSPPPSEVIKVPEVVKVQNKIIAPPPQQSSRPASRHPESWLPFIGFVSFIYLTAATLGFINEKLCEKQVVVNQKIALSQRADTFNEISANGVEIETLIDK